MCADACPNCGNDFALCNELNQPSQVAQCWQGCDICYQTPPVCTHIAPPPPRPPPPTPAAVVQAQSELSDANNDVLIAQLEAAAAAAAVDYAQGFVSLDALQARAALALAKLNDASQNQVNAQLNLKDVADSFGFG